ILPGRRRPRTTVGRNAMASRLTAIFAAAAVVAGAAAFSQLASRAAPTLDYDFFKSRAQPIFLQKRDTHTRCYGCHAQSHNCFRLEWWPTAARPGNEAPSAKTCGRASRLGNPGIPDTSRLLMQRFAPESGGTIFHSGGRQFGSKDARGWKTLAAWVNGQK